MASKQPDPVAEAIALLRQLLPLVHHIATCPAWWLDGYRVVEPVAKNCTCIISQTETFIKKQAK